jgi:hypothetical protein
MGAFLRHIINTVMKAFYRNFFFMFFMLVSTGVLFSIPALGQHENRITATTKTSLSEDFDLRDLKNNQRRTVSYLVVTDIRDIAYGNRCVSEATRRMGFVYTPMPINEVERRSRTHYFFHNQFTKFKITLKHGPNWKKKLKKSIKRCG